MRNMIGLSVTMGMPWEYFASQDDEVIATYLDILERASKRGKSSSGEAHQAAPRMSG